MKKVIWILLLFTLVVSGCGYSPDKDDIVNEYGKVTNIVAFQNFIDNVKNDKEDKIRIVNYTDEGDPILHDVNYNGEAFISKLDFSRDKYSSGGTSTVTCKSLDIEGKEETKIYKLIECNQDNSQPTLLIIRE
ncbi:DUF4362 domain-containing protein [Tenuibacillus multivorans]|uniref:DUF4362 domain-containing protein n=1 Tax=Tenuibacillus multivorans TaxID=237069 RepID=A0A1H0D1G7_9BACI|nr:DUF4362 domain-containing protein [Tenuibacillus multivorans]GEL76085.1 hypothetical protein TMU01_03200 [Tenuibacillus multivorans]SDN63876.1 protein of unknown function [Tenuibacillus multivorans]